MRNENLDIKRLSLKECKIICNGEVLVPLKEATQMVGVTKPTFLKWRQNGTLPIPVGILFGIPLYAVSDLDIYLSCFHPDRTLMPL